MNELDDETKIVECKLHYLEENLQSCVWRSSSREVKDGKRYRKKYLYWVWSLQNCVQQRRKLLFLEGTINNKIKCAIFICVENLI